MRVGNVMAASAFVLWGILPLYYQYLPQAAMDELLALRIIASVPLCALLVLMMTKHWPSLTRILSDRRSLFYTVLGALLNCISWMSFTWAITHGRVIDASLGFFISPLTLTGLGVIALKDKLSTGNRIALILGISGVTCLSINYGHVPYIALSMAVFFTLYSWCKKQTNYDWSTALYVEVAALMPVALAYMVMKEITVGCDSLHQGITVFTLYLGSAPTTIIPLLCYTLAVRWTRMSTIGMMQYIEPSLQFIIATMLFGEAFSAVKMICFSLIWMGLMIIIIESVCVRYGLSVHNLLVATHLRRRPL